MKEENPANKYPTIIFNQEAMDNFIALGRALKKMEIEHRMDQQLQSLSDKNKNTDNV